MARLLDNFYILKTESGIKLTYVRSVPGEGDLYGERNQKTEKMYAICDAQKVLFLTSDSATNGSIWEPLRRQLMIRKKTFDGLRSGLKVES